MILRIVRRFKLLLVPKERRLKPAGDKYRYETARGLPDLHDSRLKN